MKNKKIIFVYATVFLLLTISVSVLEADNQKKENEIFKINYIDEYKIEITVKPQSFDYHVIEKNHQNFALIELNDEGFTTTIGEAQLPCIRRMLEIPQGANPEIIVKTVSWSYTSLDKLNLPGKIIPVQPSLVKLPEAFVDFAINNQYYNTNDFVPLDFAKIVSINEIRSRPFVLIELSPLQYKPSTGELRIMNNCEITINLHNSDIKQTYEKINRYTSKTFEELFKTYFVNYGFYEKDILNNPKDQEGYLIIVYDNFYNNIQTFANWKTSKGFDVTVKKTSEIPGGPTKEN
ncbi:MAG: C25 family peptidase propeptide domain-containing protein, partial [Candidatus Thermoplasmatota archaeon]|nr:C25 family peptidase propeptide domain-containing protein [Candidatus Thermoplasmatota archaeon]